MQYELLGFSQAKAVELGLCVADLAIIRWFVNFMGTDKMTKKVIDGKDYYWIRYDGLLDDLPILHITKVTLYRRLKDLVAKDVLEHVTVREAGTYSFYRLGKNYLAMITDNLSGDNPKGYVKKAIGYDEKVIGYDEKVIPPMTKMIEQNINILKRQKERKEESESYDEIITSLVDKVELQDVLYEFIKMRKLIKKPMTNRALKRIIMRLKEFSGEDIPLAIEILDQSIRNNWQDIYPLKKFEKNAYVKKEAVSIPVNKKDKVTNPDGSYVKF